MDGYGLGPAIGARRSAMAHWVLIPLAEEDLAGSLCWRLLAGCLVSCDHCCRYEQGEQDAVGERVHKPLRGYYWSSPGWELLSGALLGLSLQSDQRVQLTDDADLATGTTGIQAL